MEEQHHNMGQRGVTRPMEMMSHPMMSEEDRLKMLHEHHQKTLWIYWSLILLGAWLIIGPFTFSFSQLSVTPAGTRHLWLGLSSRILCLQLSDVISGLLLLFIGFRTLKANRPLSLWMSCAIGVWLNAAPLIFWAPNALIYLNDTLVGVLVIALTILIPGMPNMVHYMKMGAEVPLGWSYNPSSWAQRSILIFLGFAGWMVSRYLMAYQFGYIDHIWDPFFGDSTRIVLTSKMSQSLPISDAGLGSFAYTFEFLMGWMGSSARWRTMPWMVAFFGILVIPLGLVHIFLVISQPLTVGHWCFFCLVAAGVMLPMIPLEVDEVVAMVQFLHQSKVKQKPLWTTFWKGESSQEQTKDERTPSISSFHDKPMDVFRASLWGMSFPLTLILTALFGIWLMISPSIFGSVKSLADAEHLCGALVLTFSVIAMGEVVRTFRFLNIIICSLTLCFVGMKLKTSPFEIVNLAGFSGLIIILSIFRGSIKEHYGSFKRFII